MIFSIILSSCSNAKDGDQPEVKTELKNFLVGTYTQKEGHVDGKADGIYLMSINMASGQLTVIDTIKGISNPSYITIHPNGRFFYAVSEVAGSEPIGEVLAYEYNPGNQKTTFLNKRSTYGNAPCHLSVNPDERSLYVVNYMGGVINYKINSDGSLAPDPQIINYEGGSEGSSRQEAPHPHMIRSNQDDQKVYATDLGTNELIVYKVADGLLSRHDALSMSEQAGPRHFDFHSNGKIYILNELNNTIEIVDYDSQSDEYRIVQQVNNYDKMDRPDATSSSAIKIHPDGKYLYAAQRGHGQASDSKINVFAIDDKGIPSFIHYVQSKGDIPRDFEIDPSGQFLIVANQDSDNMAVFKIDQNTGRLKDLNMVKVVPTPVCIKFL